MDKYQDRKPKSITLSGQNDHGEFDFIKDKPYLVYLISKIKKLSGVIHILTSSLPPEEPIRTSLRHTCLSLLKDSFRLKDGNGLRLESAIVECVSLVDVARLGLVMSNMNASILRREFLDLLSVLHSLYEKEGSELSFDKGQLSVESPIQPLAIKDKVNKGHRIRHVLYKADKKTLSVSADEDKGQNKSSPDSTRERMIIDIIRNKGEVGVKDISALIRGVSGKTIQRDLLSLVLKGVLKKEGERRWSRYSIVS